MTMRPSGFAGESRNIGQNHHVEVTKSTRRQYICQRYVTQLFIAKCVNAMQGLKDERVNASLFGGSRRISYKFNTSSVSYLTRENTLISKKFLNLTSASYSLDR